MRESPASARRSAAAGAAALLLALPLAAQDWRMEAEARIEKFRKGELTVEVTSATARPLAGVPVRVRMLRHAFGWGTAVSAQTLLAQTADAARYRQELLRNFNMAVLENDLKWPQWERDPKRALDAVEWLRAQGISRIRGHNLIWPSWRWLPRNLRGLEDDPPALRRRALDHIRDEVTATRGLLEDWDVVNEPYTNHDLLDILGVAEMDAWFRMAREFDPKAVLYLNDFNILSARGLDRAHQDHFFETIRFLIRRGAPLGGIGMQGHFREVTPPERVLKILDRFAAFSLPVRITEFDFETKDEELQAAFTRDLLTVCFSHPAVDAFLMWGFWEGRHWRPDGAMLRRDWTPKPNFEVWREMVFRRWWTDQTVKSGSAGALVLRAFRGEYEISAPGAVAVKAVVPGRARLVVTEGTR